MKRRCFLQSIPLLSTTGSLSAQQIQKIETTGAEIAAVPVPRFFSEPELAALRRLSDLLMPALGGTPGALAAGVPEFLDFLIGESPLARRGLYRSGLDALNTRAVDQFGKAFTALDASQAETLLSPLREPWTWDEPSDVFAAFLRSAKADILTATVNSREWIEVVSQRNRSAAGVGSYWLPAD